MHQVSMHVLLEHPGSNEVRTAKFKDLLLGDELVLIIDNFFILFLQLFSDILNIWYPLGSAPKLRYEVASNFRIFKCC